MTLGLATHRCRRATSSASASSGTAASSTARVSARARTARIGDVQVALDGFDAWVTFLSRRDPGLFVLFGGAARCCAPRWPSRSGCRAAGSRSGRAPNGLAARAARRAIRPPLRRARAPPAASSRAAPMTSVLDLWRAVDPEARLVSGSIDRLSRPVRGIARTRAAPPHLPPVADGAAADCRHRHPRSSGSLDAPARRRSRRAALEPVAVWLVSATAWRALEPRRRRPAGPRSERDPVVGRAPTPPSGLPRRRARAAGAVRRRAATGRRGGRPCRPAARRPRPASSPARLRRGVAVTVDGALRLAQPAPGGARPGHALCGGPRAAAGRALGGGAPPARTRDGLWVLERSIGPAAAAWLFDDLPFARIDEVGLDALAVTLRALLRRRAGRACPGPPRAEGAAVDRRPDARHPAGRGARERADRAGRASAWRPSQHGPLSAAARDQPSSASTRAGPTTRCACCEETRPERIADVVRSCTTRMRRRPRRPHRSPSEGRPGGTLIGRPIRPPSRGSPWPPSKLAAALKLAEDRNLRFVSLQFTDIVGQVKSVQVPMHQLEEAVEHGKWFDGSSIEGFARIAESDMFLVPDLATFSPIPWEPGIGPDGKEKLHTGSARVICDVYDAERRPLPRRSARRPAPPAGDRAKKLGLHAQHRPGARVLPAAARERHRRSRCRTTRPATSTSPRTSAPRCARR